MSGSSGYEHVVGRSRAFPGKEALMEEPNGTSLHREAIVVDGLYHTIVSDPPPGGNHVDQLIEAGVTAVNLTIIDDVYPTGTIKDALAHVYEHLVLLDAHPESLLHVLAPSDIVRAKREKKLGIVFGTQGSAQLERDIRWITVLHRLGVRVLQITYNEHTAAGSGCQEENDTGLTRFGRQLIAEMNRLGMTVDLSHVGYRTSREAVNASTAPVIFSHSGVKALVDNPRNINDDQIRAAAESGGVIGLCPHSVMCARTGERPKLNDFLDQLEYVAELVGIDHVAIGTDRFMSDTLYFRMLRTSFERSVHGFFGGFGPNEKHVDGFNRLNDWPNVTQALLQRGLSPTDVRKILGENWLRVYSATWGRAGSPAPVNAAAIA